MNKECRGERGSLEDSFFNFFAIGQRKTRSKLADMAAVPAPSAASGVSASGLRQETISKATETMFEKITEYVKGELHGKPFDCVKCISSE